MAVAPSAGDAVGAVLNGQWKLLRLIGEGGLAAVYEADGLQGQGKRAIKLLHAHFRSQSHIMERFYAEAKACFSLRHPHIASVEAYAYAEDGSPYIVMELLQGMSLEEFLSSHESMRPEQAAPIVYGILQALSVAHARGIVHRDLKPANLFLVPDGRGQHSVKVLDFGIAKVMDLAGGMGTKTRTGAVLGTPGYMSPEQVKNAKAVDTRSDLWAAGVVFYEMLSCQHPWGQTDQLARMVAVLRDAATPISRVAPQLAAWDPFFARALDRDPERRFQSAEEMAQKVRELAQGTPARFVPDGVQTVALPLMPDRIQPDTQGARREATAQMPASQAPQPYAEGHGQGSPGHGGTEVGGYRAGMQASTPPPAPPAGAYPGGSTQVSESRPQGTPTIHSDVPAVNVVDAPEPEPLSLVWWGVALVGVGGFALGLMVGYLLAG
jgi:serine/threonine-protein kinase